MNNNVFADEMGNLNPNLGGHFRGLIFYVKLSLSKLVTIMLET